MQQRLDHGPVAPTFIFFSKLKTENPALLRKQEAERLKSRKRRPEVDRLNGRWAQWSISSKMVNRNDG